MIRYTTPIIPLEVEGIDLTTNEDVYVSIVQGNNYLEKRNADLTITYNSQTDISTIILSLTQEESASFAWKKDGKIQVNFIDSAGVRDATNIVEIPVLQNLLDRKINYGD